MAQQASKLEKLNMILDAIGSGYEYNLYITENAIIITIENPKYIEDDGSDPYISVSITL